MSDTQEREPEPQEEPIEPGIPLRPDPGSPETRGGSFEKKGSSKAHDAYEKSKEEIHDVYKRLAE